MQDSTGRRKEKKITSQSNPKRKRIKGESLVTTQRVAFCTDEIERGERGRQNRFRFKKPSILTVSMMQEEKKELETTRALDRRKKKEKLQKKAEGRSRLIH